MVLDGKALRDKTFANLKDKIKTLNLSLAIIQIGDDEASNVYIKQKKKMCEELSIIFKHHKFAADVNETKVIQLISELNQDDTTGILLQLPVPPKFNASFLQNLIIPEKDIDGLTELSVGKLVCGNQGLMPCTAKGVVEMLKAYAIPITGKHAVVVGRSNLVGKPTASLLLNENATVTVCHRYTENLKAFTSKADILVVAVGKKHLITADMVKKGAVIIDVGINKVDGKLYGDVDYEKVKTKCQYITPVPGGVGPMTIAMLAQNIYEAYLLQKKTSD